MHNWLVPIILVLCFVFIMVLRGIHRPTPEVVMFEMSHDTIWELPIDLSPDRNPEKMEIVSDGRTL